jgi:hypothetical protein
VVVHHAGGIWALCALAFVEYSGQPCAVWPPLVGFRVFLQPLCGGLALHTGEVCECGDASVVLSLGSVLTRLRWCCSHALSLCRCFSLVILQVHGRVLVSAFWQAALRRAARETMWWGCRLAPSQGGACQVAPSSCLSFEGWLLLLDFAPVTCSLPKKKKKKKI